LFIRLAIPKKRVVKNLSAAFGQSYSISTKEGLAKGVQEHFVANLLDCFMQMSDDEHAKKVIDVHGIDHLEAALRKDKGVIALGAHIGNFVLLGTRLGLEGHRFHTLFRIPPDPRIKNLIERFLCHYHQSVIPSLPKRSAVNRILEALKRNEIVYILGDNLKKGRIEALLFGQRVPSPRGPISLALRSGAPLVPMYLIRNYEGRLNLIIEPELSIARNGNLARDIEDNTKAVVSYLERLIRQYPDQWNWLTIRLTRYQSDRLNAPTRNPSPRLLP
jgi:KDO2-lipid IV(A) lauroyltransferase